MVNNKQKSGLSDRLRKYMQANSLRITPEREALFEAVTTFKGRFTVDDLADYFTNYNFKLSRATLYNTIHLFELAGIVRQHKIVSDKAVYEVITESTPLSCFQEVCTVCGKIRDFPDSEITRLIQAQIYGICYGCLRKQKKANSKLTNQ